jgi:hypothetical protein
MLLVLAATAAFSGGAAAQNLSGASAEIQTACKTAGGSDTRCRCMGTAFDPDGQGDALADRTALLALWKAGIAAPGFMSGSPAFTLAEATSAVQRTQEALSERVVQIYWTAFGQISAACRPL